MVGRIYPRRMTPATMATCDTSSSPGVGTMLWRVLVIICVTYASGATQPSGTPPICDFLRQNEPAAAQLAPCKWPVKQFVILGERNSGINYVSELLKDNIKAGSLEYLHEFPKHWPLWGLNISVPARTLFFLVTRNANDWLRAMHSNCNCCEGMQQHAFSDFLTRPYNVTPALPNNSCPAFESALPDGSPHPNLMSLRSAKLRMHLHLGKSLLPWFIRVRLEDLWCAADPAQWLRSHLSSFCLSWAQPSGDRRLGVASGQVQHQEIADSFFFNSKHHCENNAEAATQAATINRWLRKPLERHIGYPLLTC